MIDFVNAMELGMTMTYVLISLGFGGLVAGLLFILEGMDE